MKTHRILLFISILLIIISTIMIIFIPKNIILYQFSYVLLIAMILSFILELANYLNLRNKEINNLYNSLLWIKAKSFTLINTINFHLVNNFIISNNIFDNNIQEIHKYKDSLSNIDENLYMLKKKHINLFQCKNMINNTYNTLCTHLNNFTLHYTSLNMDKKDIYSKDLEIDLVNIIKVSESLIKCTNDVSHILFNKDRMNQWIIDNNIVINSSNTFR